METQTLIQKTLFSRFAENPRTGDILAKSARDIKGDGPTSEYSDSLLGLRLYKRKSDEAQMAVVTSKGLVLADICTCVEKVPKDENGKDSPYGTLRKNENTGKLHMFLRGQTPIQSEPGKVRVYRLNLNAGSQAVLTITKEDDQSHYAAVQVASEEATSTADVAQV